ncbi:MAG: PA2779 family protein [Burkholderiales bacterium]
MKSLYKLVCQLLIVSMMLLPFSTQAGMIGTDQVVAGASDQTNRDKVVDFMTRTDVLKKFETLGLTAATAQDRVNAMTQEEINRIAGKIDSLPAGASSNGAWIAVAVIIVAAIVYYVYYK